MGKEDAPQGPDWKDLQAKMAKYAKQNSRLFEEAMKFGKDQFSKGEEWVQKLNDFGLDAMGKLGSEAENFRKTTADRVAGLDKQGAAWAKSANDIYNQNKALADKVTGELMPGMGKAAETGNTLLDSYMEQGIPFQDEYIAKLAGWDTTARREDRAAQAVNDIAMTTEAARESELRRLESYGIDPSQTRSAALDSRLQAQNAIAKAVASNTARQAVETEGIQLGKTASDMYEARRTGGLESIKGAADIGKVIAEIARQPGADYMSVLAQLGQYGINVGQLEQSGQKAVADMINMALGFGERGATNAATQQNANSKYGSSLYDQAAQGVKQGADIINSGFQTSGQLNANDAARVAANNQNSWGAQLGTLAGVAAPFVLGPAGAALGTAIGGAAGSAITGAATAASGAPLAGTTYLANSQRYSEGGPVKHEESPSRGAIPDDVPAMIDAGEYIIDRDTVRWFGEKHFADLQKKARQGRGIPEQAGA